MNDGEAWAPVQEADFSSFAAGDGFNLNDMTGFDGAYFAIMQPAPIVLAARFFPRVGFFSVL